MRAVPRALRSRAWRWTLAAALLWEAPWSISSASEPAAVHAELGTAHAWLAEHKRLRADLLAHARRLHRSWQPDGNPISALRSAITIALDLGNLRQAWAVYTELRMLLWPPFDSAAVDRGWTETADQYRLSAASLHMRGLSVAEPNADIQAVWRAARLANDERFSPPLAGLQPVAQAINEFRAALGLSELSARSELARCANDQLRRMRAGGYFAHADPRDGSGSLALRASACRTPVRAELLARKCRDGEQAFRRWFASPAHHRAMIDPAARAIGVAAHEGRYVAWIQ